VLYKEGANKFIGTHPARTSGRTLVRPVASHGAAKVELNIPDEFELVITVGSKPKPNLSLSSLIPDLNDLPTDSV
jgi:hypothetical protein